MVAITCIIALLALAFAADSATIHVDWSGGGDYTSIQPALTAALGGDTILIVPGTYTGEDNRNLTLGPSKDLVIESESGLSTVTVDCQGQDRAFYLHSSGQSRDTVIRGLLFRNGYTDNYNGGGIILSGVDPIIEYCIFHGMEFRHDVHLRVRRRVPRGAGSRRGCEPGLLEPHVLVLYGNPGGDFSGSHDTTIVGDPLFCGYYSDDFTICDECPRMR